MANNTARRLDIFEVFEKTASIKKKSEKVEFLREQKTGALTDVLRGFYDERVQWLLPEGKPPYTPNLPESTPSTLLKQHLKFKYFVKSPFAESIKAMKRESIFIGVLESIHPQDAMILVDMINKKSIKGVTKKLVGEAFPGLLG